MQITSSKPKFINKIIYLDISNIFFRYWSYNHIGKVSNKVSVLHSRLKTFMGHMSDISKELGKAGAKVNSVFSSYNKSVLPSIRRIEDITAQSDEIEELKVESSLEKNSQ